MAKPKIRACRDLVERTDGKWSYIVYFGEIDCLVPVVVTPEWFNTEQEADQSCYPAIDQAYETFCFKDQGNGLSERPLRH